MKTATFANDVTFNPAAKERANATNFPLWRKKSRLNNSKLLKDLGDMAQTEMNEFPLSLT